MDFRSQFWAQKCCRLWLWVLFPSGVLECESDSAMCKVTHSTRSKTLPEHLFNALWRNQPLRFVIELAYILILVMVVWNVVMVGIFGWTEYSVVRLHQRKSPHFFTAGISFLTWNRAQKCLQGISGINTSKTSILRLLTQSCPRVHLSYECVQGVST